MKPASENHPEIMAERLLLSVLRGWKDNSSARMKFNKLCNYSVCMKLVTEPSKVPFVLSLSKDERGFGRL
ncbi:MAG: hypothetical protein ACRESZ_21600, partial [Methylococcales bacterium]